jgi:DNA-binding PadR family transcriptional regulator
LRIYLLQIYILSMATGTAPAAPLSPAVFAILLSLAEGEKHGYLIMKDARAPQGGGVQLGPGTLYGSLDRMMRDGLVEESGISDDERRRYYRLTNLGQSVLAVELERLDAAVASARSLGLIPHGGRS